MDWSSDLLPEESVLWEGRPAPGCFTYRNWRHSVFGILLLLFSSFWQMVGYQLQLTYQMSALLWIPVPFVLISLYLAVGHHLLARLEWEKVFYAVTNRRILARRGYFRPRLLTLDLGEVASFRVQSLGAELASFKVNSDDPAKTLTLSCIEHPRRLTALLELALAENARRKEKGDAPEAASAGEHP